MQNIKTVLKTGGCVLLVVVAIGGALWTKQLLDSSPGRNSPKSVAAAFTEATYSGDYEEIFPLLPEALQTRSIQSTKNMTGAGDDAEVLSYQGEALTSYIGTLNGAFGSDWDFQYEIGDVEYYTSEELKELNLELKMMGVEGYEANKAARVQVEAAFQAVNGTEGSAEFYVPVIRSGLTWSLGQYIGTGAPDPALTYYTRYGDLMDGFAMEGAYDAEGNRLHYDAEGYEITEEDDGTWIGYDEYGNIRHYDSKQNLVSVTGPDGGEALTESTWADYYDSDAE